MFSMKQMKKIAIESYKTAWWLKISYWFTSENIRKVTLLREKQWQKGLRQMEVVWVWDQQRTFIEDSDCVKTISINV